MSAPRLMACLPDDLEAADNDLTSLSRALFHKPLQELRYLQQRIKALDEQLKQRCTQNEAIQRLETLPGIGPLGASA